MCPWLQASTQWKQIGLLCLPRHLNDRMYEKPMYEEIHTSMYEEMPFFVYLQNGDIDDKTSPEPKSTGVSIK